jgi:hypothetical protein
MKLSSLKAILLFTILILLTGFLAFLIIRLTLAMWNEPYLTTPVEKIIHVATGWGLLLVGLVSMMLISYKQRKELKGEVPPDIDRKNDYLIFVAYIVWIIIWELYDYPDSYYHYHLEVLGLLIITIIWSQTDLEHWWSLLKEFWWKLID